MEKEAMIDLLSSQELFRGLRREHLARLAAAASPAHLRTEEVLFRQDAEADRFFLILHGEVSVEIPAVYGHPVEIQVLHDGDVLGWSWLFPPHRWHFDARAARTTELLAFDARKIRDACEKDHDFGYEILKRFGTLMMHRLEAARLKVMQQA